MKNLISNFPSQIQEALQIGKSAGFTAYEKNFRQIVVSGLGGSGIGASIVTDYCFALIKIPIIVNKNYFIPSSVNEDTLFIACSYSGNTEETLQAVKAARQNKASIVCITSGGELASYAKKTKLPCIRIPEGMPPRACLGYSMIQLLFVLKYNGILKTAFAKEISEGLALIQKEEKAIHKIAHRMAGKLTGKEIAIYATAGYEGLAIRFRQQLNENSKVLAWHNVIPEMTHNEIVGWKKAHENLATVLCYHRSDFGKNVRRLQYLRKVLRKYGQDTIELLMKGESFWAKTMYFIHVTDWVSVYLAELNGNDAMEVRVIDGLKKEMAKK